MFELVPVGLIRVHSTATIKSEPYLKAHMIEIRRINCLTYGLIFKTKCTFCIACWIKLYSNTYKSFICMVMVGFIVCTWSGLELRVSIASVDELIQWNMRRFNICVGSLWTLGNIVNVLMYTCMYIHVQRSAFLQKST